jgi:hypothetical protein
MNKLTKNIFVSLLFSFALAVLCVPAVGTEAAACIGTGLFVSSFYVPKTAGVLFLNNTNNASARESYQHAKRMFARAFRDKFNSDQAVADWVDTLKLSQSEIRLEVTLNITNNSFVFGLTPNQVNSTNVQFPTETRLNLQDSLCVNEYGIFVAQPTSNNDAAYKLHTYGNTQDFAAADAAALDSTFYHNGGFQIKCNNDVICPYRGLFNHYYAPQTQQTAALGAGSPKDQLRGAEDGMITAEPNVVLIGSKNYVPEIVLKSAMASAAAFERAIIIFRGILAQNSTVVS